MRQIAIHASDGRVVCRRCAVADGPLTRMRGLLGRSTLDADEGLLLKPAGSVHTFFMRFPIDAVFLGRPAADGTRRVVAVHANLRPWTGVVWYARGADSCLELPAGTAAASATAVGDAISMAPEPAAGD